MNIVEICTRSLRIWYKKVFLDRIGFKSDNFLQQYYPGIHHLNRDQNLIGGQMAVQIW